MNGGLFEQLADKSAEMSPCAIYRYTLTREWDDGPCVAFLMFNPSTADAVEDDPTIRKCIGFAKRWGYARLVVVNLYAVRSTNPKAVGRMGESAIGPLNNYWIRQAFAEAREVICAWGCAQHAKGIEGRIQDVLHLVNPNPPDVSINCLGYRKDGHPRHPLMLAYETPREPFSPQHRTGAVEDYATPDTPVRPGEGPKLRKET